MKDKGKKIWRTVGNILFWGAVVAYLVWAFGLREHAQQGRRVEHMEVIVRDSLESSFITPATIINLVNEAGENPVGKRVDSLNLGKINRLVEDFCFTARAITYVDYNNTLTVELTQREPLLRVCTDNGYDFYLTQGLYVLPIEPLASPNLPVVSGRIDFPFGTSFRGDLKEWLLGEEKKYKDCYNFLCKLINFVVLTESTPSYEGKIVQIVATPPKTKAPRGEFGEPHFKFIPRYGDYVVEIGSLDDVEAKLYRWSRFAEAQVVDMSAGGILNVEYEGQALWKAPQAPKKKK